jgi:hypothetical protein
VCLMYLSVGCLVVNSVNCEFTTKHPTDKYIRHTHTHTHIDNIQPHYQINNLMTQTSREVVTALSTKDGPLKMVKQQ